MAQPTPEYVTSAEEAAKYDHMHRFESSGLWEDWRHLCLSPNYTQQHFHTTFMLDGMVDRVSTEACYGAAESAADGWQHFIDAATFEACSNVHLVC